VLLTPAHAQERAVVVSSAPTFTAGETRPVTQTTAGELRVSVTSGGGGGVAQGAATSGQLGTLEQCAVTTAAPTYTTGTINPVSCDVSGSQRVAVANTVSSTSQGLVPASTATVGNPVPVGGVVATANPADWVAGDRAELQFSPSGSAIVAIGSPGAQASIAGNVQDAQATQSALAVRGMNQIWDSGASQWFNLRSFGGVTTSAAGVPAAGVVGIFQTTPPTLTDGQAGRAQLSTRGSLRSLGTVLNITAADDLPNNGFGTLQDDGVTNNATRPTLTGGLVFDGTAWDRQRSGATVGSTLVEPTKLGQTTRTPVWASGQHLSTSTTSTRTTAITGTEAIISCSAAGYINVGTAGSVVATVGAGSLFLGAGVPFTVQITSGQSVAAILPSGTGACSVIPVA
jgi:hypothetical protein